MWRLILGVESKKENHNGSLCFCDRVVVSPDGTDGLANRRDWG